MEPLHDPAIQILFLKIHNINKISELPLALANGSSNKIICGFSPKKWRTEVPENLELSEPPVKTDGN
jgi:hypothetical protein